jgi:hypothetical protein
VVALIRLRSGGYPLRIATGRNEGSGSTNVRQGHRHGHRCLERSNRICLNCSAPGAVEDLKHLLPACPAAAQLCLLVILLQPPCYSSVINAPLPQLSTTWYSTERACISAESVVAQHIPLSSGWDLVIKGVRTSGPLHYHSYLCCNITHSQHRKECKWRKPDC